ncbi:PIN domain-containing protein [Polaribacter sp. Hel_I_88]|uniref:PIN domain-containing protein n=1 Tax=Polaribacter sp. Hel_I_88 TaxID=1250006 RepID=UPI00047EF814|nr:PIN domain-containing protein [Polaribacter sp. Hel_I_88]
MKSILIDSDILIDILIERTEFLKDSKAILDLCEKKKIKGYITPVILSNTYYIINKKYKREKIVPIFLKLLNFIEIASIDKMIILKALNSNFKDFEDALQNYAAEYSKKIDIIITRNTKDYKNSNLAVLTPETYLKTLIIL